MVCQHCGAANVPGDRFCGNCGQVLPSPGSAPQHQRGTVAPSPAAGAPTIRALNPPGVPAGTPSDWSAPTQAVPRPPTAPPPDTPDPWARARQQPVSPYAPASPPYPQAPTWNGPAYAPPQPPIGRQAAQPPQPPKKRRRWPLYFLLTLVILGGVVAGAWVFFLRPIAHQDAETQIQRGLQAGVNQVPLNAAQDAPAGLPFVITDDQMNSYLSGQLANLAPISAIHVSLEPGVVVVDLTTFSFGSTVRLGLAVDNGKLVVQNVQVSGLLWWVENGSELTPVLNNALHQVQDHLGRSILAISVNSGNVAVIFQ